MSNRKKNRDDDELKKLLHEGWPADEEEERTEFLHRLKLILPPDHPGLLCLQGKSKKANGNGANSQGEVNWRRRRIASLAATWSFILIVVFLTYFGVHSLLGSSPDITSTPKVEGTQGHGSTGSEGELAKETKTRYIYRLQGLEIKRSKLLSIQELNTEMNRAAPGGIAVTITGMRQVDGYTEETSTVIYNVAVFELEGFFGKQVDEERENGITDME